MKYCLRIWQMEPLFTVAPFSKKSIVIGLFMSQITVSMTYTDTTPRTLSLPESQYVFTPWTVFLTQVHSGKPMFNQEEL